jgi:deazaflavin-dependent oxidoreductase (nitroreductase family)
MVSDFNAEFIEEFRGNGGRVGGRFEDQDVLILHTNGTRSGLRRLAPLRYRREGDRNFVFASNSGSDTHPGWYHNLKADPNVTVEIGSDTSASMAVEIVGEERDAIYARQAATLGIFATYQAGTNRTIPVIELVTE